MITSFADCNEHLLNLRGEFLFKRASIYVEAVKETAASCTGA